jgi:hypothetical protein
MNIGVMVYLFTVLVQPRNGPNARFCRNHSDTQIVLSFYRLLNREAHVAELSRYLSF